MRISDWSSDVCSSDLIDQARAWVQGFVAWYNTEHRHSGIQFVTPAQRHAGADCQILAGRIAVYEAAKQANPTRWRGRTVRSEEHTSELQSLMRISYAVFCLKKKIKETITIQIQNYMK